MWTWVPTLSKPSGSSGLIEFREVISMCWIIWGVERTRAFSAPRKSIATAEVTSSRSSPLVPTGMFAMSFILLETGELGFAFGPVEELPGPREALAEDHQSRDEEHPSRHDWQN